MGDRGALDGEPVQGGVPIAVLHAFLPLRRRSEALPSAVCASVGRGGIPVYGPALGLDLSPTMRGNEDHASARPDPGARAERRDRRRLRLLQWQRRRRRSRRADSGRRPAVPRGRRAPRRPGPQRPRGGAEEDPAHRRPRREDPATRRQQRQERRRHLQGRRRAVGGQPRRLRHHRAAQRPERRLRRGHRLQGRRQGREAARQAEGHRQALLQRHRLPLRRQGEDGDRAHRPPRRGRHRRRAEGRSSTARARTTSTRPTA